ncbi:putative bifunctional diguanylate cyclase/phosphodiesterase [Sphingomonas hengshuiensis]|nr:EAL domain-containing protein [Sphingomonas hengshuiensis]
MNALAVAYTHYPLAPALLTIAVPAALSTLCIARTVSWLRARTAGDATPEYAVMRLRRTTAHAAILGLAYVIWSLSLDQFGGPFERAHIAVFIPVTVIGCIFCLMHVPQAALVLTGVVMVPYLLHYVSVGNAVFTAIAFNVALVTMVIIRVLFNSFAGFNSLVRSKDKLAAKQREAEQLSHENAIVALTDSLTGLPNRRFFFAKLDEVLRAKAVAQARFAVGVLDLDRFKPLNDTYGHAVGDRLLAQVGMRLQSAAADGVIVARLGGDEFGLLILEDVDRAAEIGQEFCDLLARPFKFDDIQVSLGASCGLSIYPEAGATAHALFDRSDYALYHVKAERRGGSGVFSLAHETTIRSERLLENALREADLEAELDVQFQPIVNIDAMTVVGVEALARWTSPKLGRVPTDSFIAMAERTGLIHSITLTLFRKALERALCLPGHIGLSFNLSANDITSPATIKSLLQAIHHGAIAPDRITFELTETALLRDVDAAERALRELRRLRVKVALDDFGTGYSSLSYLRRLAPDKIKIDKSFAADLDSISGRNIVTAIAGLCNNMGLECVFEGIESYDQLAKIHAFGYHFAQGYLFARPMLMPAFLTWLERDALRDLRLSARVPGGAGVRVRSV